MRPTHLMIHRLQHYVKVEAVATENNAAITYGENPVTIACRADSPATGTEFLYSQNNSIVTRAFYTTTNSIQPLDKIVFDGVAYRVLGVVNLSELGRVYRVDVENIK